MDETRAAVVTKSLTSVPSRRDVLRGLAGAGLALGLTRLPDGGAAKKKRKKAKKTPKARPNAFGCLDVGDACNNADQCCSGVCEGKQGKRACRAHNTGLCRPESDYCATGVLGCGDGGASSLCVLTTGKAAFCAAGGQCRDCTKDVDCEEGFGPGAACVDFRHGICATYCPDTGGTACLPAGA